MIQFKRKNILLVIICLLLVIVFYICIYIFDLNVNLNGGSPNIFFGNFLNIENITVNQNYYAMSFGGGEHNFIDAVNRIENELKSTKEFNHVIKYTHDDLKTDTDFWNKHNEFISNNKRLYGYAIWKPYLILKTLNIMNENDILFYVDAGCEISSTEESKENIKLLKNKCNDFDILYTLTGYIEKSWTKRDLFDYMNIDYEIYKETRHAEDNIIILKKNKKIIQFMNDWYYISCNYHSIDDSPSLSKNDENFVEHRHDQSVFNLLLKHNSYNYYNTNNDISTYNKSIKASRRRSG
jgi:hypothetical protein